MRHAFINGEANVTYDIAYYLGKNPIGTDSSLGDLQNSDALFIQAFKNLSNVPGSSLKLKAGKKFIIKNPAKGVELVRKRKGKNIIVVDNSADSEFIKIFRKDFHSKVIGQGGVASTGLNGQILSSFLVMNGAQFKAEKAKKDKALFSAMHELLHSLGIGHTQISDGDLTKNSETQIYRKNFPLMYPKYLGQKTQLTADDAAIIRMLYPNTKKENGILADETTGVLKVKLLYAGKPLTGYNAIAYDAKNPEIAIGAPTGFKVHDGVAIIPVPLNSEAYRDVILRISPIAKAFVNSNKIAPFENPNTEINVAGYFDGKRLISNKYFAADAVKLVRPENHLKIRAGLNDRNAVKVTLDLAKYKPRLASN